MSTLVANSDMSNTYEVSKILLCFGGLEPAALELLRKVSIVIEVLQGSVSLSRSVEARRSD